MSMHLEGPWLSTTGKKKGKKKFKNAEEARRFRELAESWDRIKNAHGIKEEKKRKQAMSAPLLSTPKTYVRDTGPRIPSRDPADMSPCTKAPDKVYTGTAIKGIGTMHKSNAVPIFTDEQAQDIARMRR